MSETLKTILFGALPLYRLKKLDDEKINSILDPVKKIKWYYFFITHVILSYLLVGFIYSVDPEITKFHSIFVDTAIIMPTLIFLTFIIEFYFIRLFFKETKLTPLEYYKIAIFILLPVFVLISIFYSIYLSFSNPHTTDYLFFALPSLLLCLLLLIFGAFTFLDSVSRKFNTTLGKLFLVMILFNFLIRVFAIVLVVFVQVLF